MSEPLKSCPFCGNHCVAELPDGLVVRRVYCGRSGCSAKGPARTTKAEAIAAWNTRAAPLPWKALAKRLLKQRWFWRRGSEMANKRLEIVAHILDERNDQVRNLSSELERRECERDERIAAAEPVMWNASQAVRDYSNAAQAARPEAKGCEANCGRMLFATGLPRWCSPECRDAGKPVRPRGAR